MLGAIYAGDIGQRMGSRATLRVMAVLYVLSAIGCGFGVELAGLPRSTVSSAASLLGGSSVLGPVYIAELAPPAYRGRLVGMFQINIVVGILLAYFSNFLIASMHLGAVEWRWEFGVSALPAVLFLIMLFGIPHSPRWLVTKGRVEEARETLIVIGTPEPEAELQAIVASIHVETSSHNEPLFVREQSCQFFWRFRLRRSINFRASMRSFITSTTSLPLLGSAASRALARPSSVGAVNLVVTLIAMTLIDKSRAAKP